MSGGGKSDGARRQGGGRPRVSVFGLGYVGAVTGACLAREGHEVVGVDVSLEKVRFVREGRSPVVEDGIDEVFRDARRSGRFDATTKASEAVSRTDMSLVCVGTPSLESGGIDDGALRTVMGEIGAALRGKKERHLVVLRSTVLPGTTEKVALPILESASGLRRGDGFGLAFNPEFLREGSSVRDFHEPPRTVAGASDERDFAALEDLYRFVDAPFVRVPLGVAEMIKYGDNAFHALKVAFANEIAVLSHAAGVDGHAVMDVIASDRKLNASPAYLRPGYAFGGSCLPKDLRALLHLSRRADLSLPLLESVLESNERQLRRGIDLVLKTRQRKIGVLGLAFKSGTDDLRESPLVRLVEALLGKGLDVKVFDRNVSVARLVGANRRYIEKEIPHIAEILEPSPDALVKWADVLVIGNGGEEHLEAARRFARAAGGGAKRERAIVDLVRADWGVAAGEPGRLSGADGYRGLCW